MALSKVMTIVNDSGSGGSSIKPKSTPSKLSAVNQATLASNYKNYVASKNSGGSGGSTGAVTQQASSGGGGGSSAFDYMSYLRSLADEAYNRARSNLDTTLNSTLGGLLDSYNSQKDVLQKKYDSSKQTLDDDNEAALRQAYINKMINARDLNQLLSAQGLTGGQSETTTANMLNNYANNRNSLNKTYATNLRELLTGHEGLLADALTAYNDKVAQARQAYSGYLAQLEQNRINAIASALPSFSQLTSLLG